MTIRRLDSAKAYIRPGDRITMA